MTNIDPSDVLIAMMNMARERGTAAKMPHVGSFAAHYGNSLKDGIGADNVDAFLEGAALVNLLVQEVSLHMQMIGRESIQAKQGDREGQALAAAVAQGAAIFAQVFSSHIGAIVSDVAEEPKFDREFEEIVRHF